MISIRTARNVVQLSRRASVQRALLRGGSALASGARRLVRAAGPRETISAPGPLVVDGRSFDVVADLVAYTGLEPDAVRALVERRLDDFRSEWHLLPTRLRDDHWYYLSSRGYMFANAVHLHESSAVLEGLRSLGVLRGRALDFGGGTGNLALALNAVGLQVDYLELSALQKDFVRFRAARHRLELRVLDWWQPLEREAYDVICALDVLEHLPDLDAVVGERLVPALRPGGALVEQSPFGATEWNPMHHEDAGLDGLLERAGLEAGGEVNGLRLWRRRS